MSFYYLDRTKKLFCFFDRRIGMGKGKITVFLTLSLSLLLILFPLKAYAFEEAVEIPGENPGHSALQEKVPDTAEFYSDGEDEEWKTAGGYIEMPWDSNTPAADDSLSYREALKEIVNEEGPSRDRYVSDPGTIQARFPDYDTEADILSYLKNKYPATRSQNPYGSCWAHSAVALSEFYMITHGLSDSTGRVDKDANYSELQLAYFCYNQAPNPVMGDTGDRVSFKKKNNNDNKDNFMNFGGNLNFAAQSLMRCNGFADDADDAAYSNAENVIGSGLADEYASSMDRVHLKNEYQISISANPRIVKQAILENGIVGVSFYAHDDYINNSTAAYYNNVNTTTNHAVAIVGWDDSYPVSNFKAGRQPMHPGAWLVRNSWTTITQFSYSSYFWLSYEDTSLNDTAYVFEMEPWAEHYDNNYYYDSELHYSDSSGYTKTANIYMVQGPEKASGETLGAVQLDVTDAANVKYTIQIFRNLSDASEPESGTEETGAKTTGRLPFAGKYTIPLNEPVALSQGESFSVVVTTEDGCIDRERDFSWKEQVIMDTAVNPGESFYYSNGSWKDFSGNTSGGTGGNVCIRALTKNIGGASLPSKIRSLSVKGKTESTLTLAWSAADRADGYDIYTASSENGSYTKIAHTDADQKKFTHTGLLGGHTYYYKVYPIRNDILAEDDVSPVLSATTLPATPVVELTKIGRYSATVRWNALSDCDGYRVEYGRQNESYWYTDVDANQTEFTAYHFDPDDACFIRVRTYKVNAENQVTLGEIGEESEKKFTTQSGTGTPVTGLKAEPDEVNYVRVSWEEQDEAYCYRVEKSEDQNVWQTVVDNLAGNYYYCGGLNNDTLYYFRVTARYRKLGQNDWDEYTSAVVSSYPKLDYVPGVEVSSSEEGITVTWSALSGANYYSVYREDTTTTDTLPLAVVASGGKLEYTDYTAVPGRLYYYMVYGCRTNELTDRQGILRTKYGTRVPLGMVENFEVQELWPTRAKVTWSPVRGAEEYVLEHYDGGWKEVARVPSGQLEYTVTGLTPKLYCNLCIAPSSGGRNGPWQYLEFRIPDRFNPTPELFTVSAENASYDGLGHGAAAVSSVQEITDAGITLSYAKRTNGTVGTYSEDLPTEAGTYQVKLSTKTTDNYTAAALTDDSWTFTIRSKLIEELNVTLSPESYVYTGNACIPSVTIREGDRELDASADYTLSYSDHVNAGTGHVIIRPKEGSNYTFSETVRDFSIGKAPYGGTKQTVDYVWSGRAAEGKTLTLPEVPAGAAYGTKGTASGETPGLINGTPSVSGRILTYNTISASAGTTAAITVPVTGADNYQDYDFVITVTVRDKADAGVSIPAGDKTVTYGCADFNLTGKTTSAGAGGVWTWSSNNTEVAAVGSTGKVTVAGAGEAVITASYESDTTTGNASIRITVNKASLRVKALNRSIVYGDMPAASGVTCSGFVNGDDESVLAGTPAFSYSYSRYGDIGSYTITPSGLSAANYNISYADGVLTVQAKTVGLSWTDTELVFNGTEQKPSAQATGLVNSDSCTVTVEGAQTDHGTYTAAAAGLSNPNYCLPAGKTVEFSIAKADPAFTKMPEEAEDLIYNGKPRELTGEGTAAGGTVYYAPGDENAPSASFTASVPSAVNAGSYYVWYQIKGDSNHKDSTVFRSREIVISKAEWDPVAPINKSYLYLTGGSERISMGPLIPLDSGRVSCAKRLEGSVEYSAGPSISEGILSYTVKSGEENAEGTITLTVETENYTNYPVVIHITLVGQKKVVLKQGTGVTLNRNFLTYGDELSTLTFKDTAVFVEEGNASNVVRGVLSWKLPSFVPAVSVNNAAWIFTPEDLSYASLEGNAEITVNKAVPEITGLPDASQVFYGQTLGDSILENGRAVCGDTEVDGTFAWKVPTIKPAVSDSNKTEYEVLFTPESGNYETVVLRCTLTVKKSNPSVLSVPVPKELTYTGGAQELVKAGEAQGGTIKYSLDGTNYTTTLPKGTDAGTYNVHYKIFGDANHLDSAVSSVSAVIGKASCENRQASAFARFGGSGEADLSPLMTAGTSPGSFVKTDGFSVLSGDPVLNGNKLIFEFRNDSENTGKSAVVSVHINGGKNYEDYTIEVTLTVLAKSVQSLVLDGVEDGKITKSFGDPDFILRASVTSGDGEVTYASSDPAIATIDSASGKVHILKAGETVLTASAAETDEYAGGTVSCRLFVKKGTPEVTPPSAGKLTYTGQPQQLVSAGSSPAGTVMEYSLSENTGYSEDLPTGIRAGEYKVWYRVTGGDNYNDVVPSSVRVMIDGASLRNAEVTLGAQLIYNGSEQTQEVSGVNVDGRPLDPSEYVISSNTAIHAGNYILYVMASDDGNYSGRTWKNYRIEKKTITPVIEISGNYFYTGSPIVPDLVVRDGETVLSSAEYSVDVSDNVNAGKGRITIDAADGDYSFSQTVSEFTIEKASRESVSLSLNALYGTGGTEDLSSFIEPGGSPGEPVVSEGDDLFETSPSVNGALFVYHFKNRREIAGRSALVLIPVTDADNYGNYEIRVRLTVTACIHADTRIVGKKEPTCTEKGYTGDLVCNDCRFVIETGEEIPADPDRHDYDGGRITREPSIFSEGIRTYTCRRCAHSYTEPVPRIDNGNDYSDLIKDTKDLSGNEAPEVRRETDGEGRIVEETIIGKEEVSRIVTDPESKKEIVETKVWIGGLESSYVYTGSPVKPDFRVYDGTKKLAEKTDYTVVFRNNKDVGTANITLRFKGNYKATEPETVNFDIKPAILGRDIIAHDTGVTVKKSIQNPIPLLTWKSTGKTVSPKFFKVEYDVPVKDAGSYTARISSNDRNFDGNTTAKVTVTEDKGLLLSSAKVIFSPKSYAYTGEEIQPSFTVKLGDHTLEEGEDYGVAGIINNVNPGTAAVLLEALSGNKAGYAGSCSASFKITGTRKLEEEGEGSPFTYVYSDSVPYAKGGAKPSVTVKDKDTLLKQGIDYTLAYSKNMSVTGGEKKAIITVKGKGRYRGSVKLKYEIAPQKLDAISSNIVVADQFLLRSKLKKPAVTITDLDGKKLSVNKDFKTENDWIYSGDETRGSVSFTISGRNQYTGTAEGSFRYMPVSSNIAKARVVSKIRDQYYTGSEVRLDTEDLTGVLSVGKGVDAVNPVPGKDFIVETYTNHVKKGTAKVTLRGIGDYAGTKTLTFRIVQKQVVYKGVLIGGEWK